MGDASTVRQSAEDADGEEAVREVRRVRPRGRRRCAARGAAGSPASRARGGASSSSAARGLDGVETVEGACARAGIVSARGRTGDPIGFRGRRAEAEAAGLMLYHLLYCGTARAMNTKYTAHVIDRSVVVDVERGEDAVEHGDAVAGELAWAIRVSRLGELESVAMRDGFSERSRPRVDAFIATARFNSREPRSLRRAASMLAHGVVGVSPSATTLSKNGRRRRPLRDVVTSSSSRRPPPRAWNENVNARRSPWTRPRARVPMDARSRLLARGRGRRRLAALATASYAREAA